MIDNLDLSELIDNWRLLNANDVRYVVSVSSGVPSAVAAKMTLDRYGHDCVDLVFMDTQREHADNYRFLDDLERVFNHKIIRLKDGRTPRDVAEQEKMVFNQRIALCTRVLKIEPFLRYLSIARSKAFKVVIVLGMDGKDLRRGRCVKPVTNYGKIGAKVSYPLLERGKRLEGKILENIVESWGIKIPYTYSLNFPHGNCLDENEGGCFKMGQGDMKRLKIHFPPAFHNFKAWELDMNERFPHTQGHGMLRDFSGGEVEYITIDEWDKRTQKHEDKQLNFFDVRGELAGEECATECGVSSFEAVEA